MASPFECPTTMDPSQTHRDTPTEVAHVASPQVKIGDIDSNSCKADELCSVHAVSSPSKATINRQRRGTCHPKRIILKALKLPAENFLNDVLDSIHGRRGDHVG